LRMKLQRMVSVRCFGTILLAALFLVGLGLSRTAAQDQAAAAPQKKTAARQTLTVTGCLQKGQEAGGHYIVGEDGKSWELFSKAVKLDEHVGHKVTLTGYQIKRSATAEAKTGPTEKAEAGEKPYADMQVTKLEMVSESCSQ